MRTFSQAAGQAGRWRTPGAAVIGTPLGAGVESPLARLRWAQWQDAVVRLLRAELAGCLPGVGPGDVDWDSWRQFYECGRTPRQAVNRALERDL